MHKWHERKWYNQYRIKSTWSSTILRRQHRSKKSYPYVLTSWIWNILCFVWKRHDTMSTCNSSRVDPNYECWMSVATPGTQSLSGWDPGLKNRHVCVYSYRHCLSLFGKQSCFATGICFRKYHLSIETRWRILVFYFQCRSKAGSWRHQGTVLLQRSDAVTKDSSNGSAAFNAVLNIPLQRKGKPSVKGTYLPAKFFGN